MPHLQLDWTIRVTDLALIIPAMWMIARHLISIRDFTRDVRRWLLGDETSKEKGLIEEVRELNTQFHEAVSAISEALTRKGIHVRIPPRR